MNLRAPLLIVPLLFGACGASGPSPTVQFQMSLTVPSGAEILRCQFVKAPPGARFVVSARHQYTPGSHHMLLYRTDVTTLTAGMDQVQDCNEGLGGTIMSHARGVLYGSQEPKGTTALPDGIGYQLGSEEVLLLQVHYLNATMAPIDSKVTVDLDTISDAARIKSLAGTLFYYDPFIDVPAGMTATAGARCTLSHDITLLGVFPHYHARGVGYRAFIDLPGTPPSADPFYTSTDWSHPAEWTGGPLPIASGSAIRWYCQYDNSGGSAEYLQGPSATNNEMCMFTGAYYPAMTLDDEECRKSMDLFGSGDQTCMQTLSCLQACPPAKPGSLPGHVEDCWQRCFVRSCPAASTALMPQLACVQTNCQSECAGGGQSCTSCVQSKCLPQAVACINAAC